MIMLITISTIFAKFKKVISKVGSKITKEINIEETEF